jgi:hypothetical protein
MSGGNPNHDERGRFATADASGHGADHGKPQQHPFAAASAHYVHDMIHEALRHITGPSKPSDWGMKETGDQNQVGISGEFYNIHQG